MNRQVQYRTPQDSIWNIRLPVGLYGRMLRALIIAMFGLGTAALPVRPAGPAFVPNPTVIGPIPALALPGDPSHDYPFLSTMTDLATNGYIEEEFLFEGAANRYIISNPLATATIRDSGHPYRTRMIVRRPVSPGAFNGTVMLELQNVAAGFDLDAGWAQSQEHLMRRGYSWIGVSGLRAGIHQAVTGLKAWSPSRYGTLDVTQGGTIIDDALCYDIFSQAAQAVRNPVGADPMGGLHVERILASGASASATRLVNYHNSIHPLAGVLDGFFIAVGGGKLRSDLDVKAFKVYSETEVSRGAVPNRQPDSDHFRHWEVAGAAHFDFHISEAVGPVQARDIGPGIPVSCGNPPLSRIPFYFVANAALDHMDNWVKYGIAPPTAPEIEIASIGPPVVIARDDFSLALGGIRLAKLAVPTALNTGVNSGPGFCILYGTFVPFDEDTIAALYRNHGAYVNQVARVTNDNLRDGFIVPEDAVATIDAAAQSGFGKR